MLREGKSKVPANWPKVAAVEKSAVAPTNSRKNMTHHHSDSEPEPEGYVPAPKFSESFGDAIALAMEKAVSGKEEYTGKFVSVIQILDL